MLTAVVKQAKATRALKKEVPIFPKIDELSEDNNSVRLIDDSNVVLTLEPT